MTIQEFLTLSTLHGGAKRMSFLVASHLPGNCDEGKQRVYGGPFAPLTTVPVEEPRNNSCGSPCAAGVLDFAFFIFILTTIVLVPACRAISRGGAWGMPGWLWSILIVCFWPIGLLWLAFT